MADDSCDALGRRGLFGADGPGGLVDHEHLLPGGIDARQSSAQSVLGLLDGVVVPTVLADEQDGNEPGPGDSGHLAGDLVVGLPGRPPLAVTDEDVVHVGPQHRRRDLPGVRPLVLPVAVLGAEPDHVAVHRGPQRGQRHEGGAEDDPGQRPPRPGPLAEPDLDGSGQPQRLVDGRVHLPVGDDVLHRDRDLAAPVRDRR